MSFLPGGSIVLPAKTVERSGVDTISVAVADCLKVPLPNIPQYGVAMQSQPLACFCRRDISRGVFPHGPLLLNYYHSRYLLLWLLFGVSIWLSSHSAILPHFRCFANHLATKRRIFKGPARRTPTGEDTNRGGHQEASECWTFIQFNN